MFYIILFQLKFKRRVYKMLNLDEKQLKNINSRTNLKKFLDHVLANNVEKVNKMCNKGLDPNFHCQESGGKCKSWKSMSFCKILKSGKIWLHNLIGILAYIRHFLFQKPHCH